jgi:hypothetical protein
MYHHLLHKVSQHQPHWPKATVKNTLLLVALILDQKTLCLWKMKGSVGKLLGQEHTQSASHYQRLKRFFTHSYHHQWVTIMQAAASLLTKATSVLIIDGTSWQWRGQTHHLLTLSVLYKGVAVPIWWRDMGKLGASNQWERRLLLRGALRLFNLKGKVLLGDREFIGRDWLATLQQADLEVVIRLKEAAYEAEIEANGKTIAKLERKARHRHGRVISQRFELGGSWYWYVLVATQQDSAPTQYLRLLSSVKPQEAVDHYGKRYRIEQLFRHLKSNGFGLERMNLEKSYKVALLLAVLVLAYTLAVVWGLKKFRRRVPLKKHGSREESAFRRGLDGLAYHLRSLGSFLSYLVRYLDPWLYPDSHALLRFVP